MTVLIFFILFFLPPWGRASLDDEVPIVLRQPASSSSFLDNNLKSAEIIEFVDSKTIKAISLTNAWPLGDIVALVSQNQLAGVVGFVEVNSVTELPGGKFEIICNLLRQSRTHFVRLGDRLVRLDLSSGNEKYKGTTDLIVKDSDLSISAKYRPLYTQGLSVGETAETLRQGEYLVTWYGQLNYGVKKWLTVNTIVPADLLGAPNIAVKSQVYRSFSNVLSTSLNFSAIPNETRSVLNLNLYWDSISSESTISHTMLSVALFSFEDAENTTAIKSLGTSSLQTGYEIILDHWDRILVGPSYNFEKKSVGGYLSYLKIFDRMHISFSLNSTDIAKLKYSTTDGYFFLFDAYWRF